jgi:hypothetical protein
VPKIKKMFEPPPVSGRFTYRGTKNSRPPPNKPALFICQQQVGIFDLNDPFVVAAYNNAVLLYPHSDMLTDLQLFNDLCNTFLAR